MNEWAVVALVAAGLLGFYVGWLGGIAEGKARGAKAMKPVGEVVQFEDDLPGIVRGYLAGPLPVGTKLYAPDPTPQE